jgi:hypothetical protein
MLGLWSRTYATSSLRPSHIAEREVTGMVPLAVGVVSVGEIKGDVTPPQPQMLSLVGKLNDEDIMPAILFGYAIGKVTIDISTLAT